MSARLPNSAWPGRAGGDDRDRLDTYSSRSTPIRGAPEQMQKTAPARCRGKDEAVLSSGDLRATIGQLRWLWGRRKWGSTLTLWAIKGQNAVNAISDQPQMRTRRSRQPCPSQKRWVFQWQGGIGSPTGHRHSPTSTDSRRGCSHSADQHKRARLLKRPRSRRQREPTTSSSW